MLCLHRFVEFRGTEVGCFINEFELYLFGLMEADQDLTIRPENLYSSLGISLSMEIGNEYCEGILIDQSSLIYLGRKGDHFTSLDGLHSDAVNNVLEWPLV